MSLAEIITTLIIALLLIKPKDIPNILENFQKLQLYFLKLKEDLTLQFNISPLDSKSDRGYAQHIKTMNYYLAKIIEMEGCYNGDYTLQEIKNYYYKIINKHHQ